MPYDAENKPKRNHTLEESLPPGTSRFFKACGRLRCIDCIQYVL